MITLRDFNEITSRKRNKMASRLKPKYWRSGKRAGKLRRAGQSLPFTLEEFRAWCMAKMGLNATHCHYCPRTIDVLNFEPDHYHPLEFGGSPGLENLVVSCEDCNRLKGAMPPEDFHKFMAFITKNISICGFADIVRRLKAGSMGIRLQYHLKVGDQKKPAQPTHQLPAPAPAPVAKTPDMFDDF